jgi:large subunit ribosomal protein L22
MKASIQNYHQAPRKVRLVADLIRGKSVPKARIALTYLDKKSAPALAKLLESAVANARFANDSVDIESLFVSKLTVDKGQTMKRVRPFKQGRAGRIHKILSIVQMELGYAPTKSSASKKSKAVVTKSVNSTTAPTDAKPVTKSKSKSKARSSKLEARS